MSTTFIVPLDGTPEAAVTLPLARTLAQVSQAQLVLLRVTSDEYPHERASAWHYLDQVAAELAADGVPVSTEVRAGDVPSEILGAVRDHQAELVVMATHGRQGLRRALTGSVAEEVLSRSPVPVVLVRPGGHRATRIRTMVVPLDGTRAGASALERAAALARSAGARIVLVHVTAPIPRWTFALAPAVDPSSDETARQSAQGYVEGLARRLRAAGIQAEGWALIGEVGPTIAAVADEVAADLIGMSTRARVGTARAVLGSTADTVVRTARRPVLLVRRTPRVGESPAAASTAELTAAV